MAFPKPLPGTAKLERLQRRAELEAHEQREMQAGLRRDGRKCRWPGCTLELVIDPCHRRDMHRGPGGNPDGSRTRRKWIIALCRQHHMLYDHGGIEIHPLDEEKYFDGPVTFHAPNPETGRMEHIASEQQIGVSVAVGA